MADNQSTSKRLTEALIVGVIATIAAAVIVYVANLHMKQFASDATVEFMAAKRVQEQATGSLMEAQKLATQIKYELSGAKRDFDSGLDAAETELADLREALTNLFGPGAIVKPNGKPVIAYDLPAMQSNISELVGKVASLDVRLTRLEERVKELSSGSSQAAALTLDPTDRQTIDQAIRVKQIPAKRELTAGKPWYELTYSIEVSPSSPTVRGKPIKDLIEKVVYGFSANWFSNPSMTSTDRASDFRVLVTVWGKTEVTADIYVRGLKDPIHRKRLMNFESIERF